MLDLAAAAPSVVQRAMSRLVASPRTFNVVVSNIPGPPVPLYIAGAAVEAIYPLGPVADGSALNITAMSYQGRMLIGLAADRATVPDLLELGKLLLAAIDDLVAVAR